MVKRLYLFLIVAMVISAPLMAEGEHNGDHGFSWWAFVGRMLNSTILFGGLIYFLRKPLRKVLTQKILDIKTDIDQREVQLKSTTSQFEEIKKRLEKIEKEVEGIRNSAIAQGNEEKLRIKKLGQEEALRIQEITNEEIDIKVESSIRNLKQRIADLTIEHFKKDIDSYLDKTKHEKIIEKNIKVSGDIIDRE
jgi:F-type H+-transporting ATPase subunit b